MVTFGSNAIAGSTNTGTVLNAGTILNAGTVLNAGLIERQEAAVEVVSSGFPGLDALLPAGGIRRGRLYSLVQDSLVQDSLVQDSLVQDSLTQVGSARRGGPGDKRGAERCSTRTGGCHTGAAQAGAGALTLACAVACRIAAASTVAGTVVIVDRGTSSSWGGGFHPPAVMPWVRRGVGFHGRHDPPPLVIARPSCDDDEIWTIDQALRCPGVAAVVAWPSVIRGRSAGSWSVAMRRWQLAAKSSGAVALLVQPAAARREPSWAEARIAVSAAVSSAAGGLLERRLRLELVGGNWAARIVSGGSPVIRAVEIAFDLTHGCERAARDTAHWNRARVGVTRLASTAEGGAGVSAAGGGAGVSTARGGVWGKEKRRVAR